MKETVSRFVRARSKIMNKQEWWAFPADELGDPLDDSELSLITIKETDKKTGYCVKDEYGCLWHLYSEPRSYSSTERVAIMNLTTDTLTDKIMEALGTERGWFLVNGILKEEIPRIVTREIHSRVESFINDFKQTQTNGGENE